MKRCPTCHKTFSDETLSFCIDDGTPLVPDSQDDSTEFDRSPETDWNPPAYKPPSYEAPDASPKRRTWPWVVGIVGALLLAMIGFTVAAILLIPRVVKKANPIIATNSNSNTSNANSNTSTVPERPVVTNSNSESSSPPPTDKEVVLAQLRDIENDWTVANVNADKKKLDQILGDDFVWQTAAGKMQGKAEYINTIERDTSIQKWEFEDLRLTLRGDRATLLGKVRFTMADKEVVYDFVDRFVWRDSRWQATGSEVTPSQ
jgi:hypothetical protein